MNLTLLLKVITVMIIAGLGWGCAEVESPASTDAFISTTLPEEPVIEEKESTSLIFSAQSGVYTLNLIDQHLTLICNDTEADVSFDGLRFMCLPESISSPVRFEDKLTGSITSIQTWERTSLARPRMASDGKTVMIPTPVNVEGSSASISVLKAFDDFGSEIAELASIVFHGFLGGNHALVNDPPELWSFREPMSELIPLGVRKVELHDFPPYGAIYEDGSQVYFFGVNESAARVIAEGDLINADRGQVLIEQDGQLNRKKLALYNLKEGTLIATQDTPPIPFNREFSARLLCDGVVLMQEGDRKRCGDDRVYFSLKSTYLNFNTNQQHVIMDDNLPHHVELGVRGKYALVTQLDNCARPTKKGWLRKIKEQENLDLPPPMRNQVLGGTISRFGGYAGIYSETTFWLIDLQSFDFRTILSDDVMEAVLGFR